MWRISKAENGNGGANVQGCSRMLSWLNSDDVRKCEGQTVRALHKDPEQLASVCTQNLPVVYSGTSLFRYMAGMPWSNISDCAHITDRSSVVPLQKQTSFR